MVSIRCNQIVVAITLLLCVNLSVHGGSGAAAGGVGTSLATPPPMISPNETSKPNKTPKKKSKHSKAPAGIATSNIPENPLQKRSLPSMGGGGMGGMGGGGMGGMGGMMGGMGGGGKMGGMGGGKGGKLGMLKGGGGGSGGGIGKILGMLKGGGKDLGGEGGIAARSLRGEFPHTSLQRRRISVVKRAGGGSSTNGGSGSGEKSEPVFGKSKTGNTDQGGLRAAIARLRAAKSSGGATPTAKDD